MLAGGGKSSTRALQRIGRVVRPFKDKQKAIVYDIWDECDYFREHAQRREQIYRTEPKWRIYHVEPR